MDDKRGYKLQEFVAHSANVNCLKIGKKTRRNFITGGDDEKVNLWSIGKPTAITSLSGHTSPIESVAFDKTEVLVAAGASSGVIKLWDLEETKVVRTLNGHRSYCTSLEFHPFGEFLASGSMDTNLKIWDFRKKVCIHTYKGHKRAVSTIRFSPDGRWVVSGGLDNVVKIWDLTAGKLLHEFKFHEGHIRSMDFHPLEFLLATGSSDKTVKFWDLETFELIGSTRPEATGVRSITFHPDGKSVFCGLDSSLKVYSWEPVICHDSVDMGWSTLGDLCIDDGKLLGCSYYQNSVAVWVADTTLIEPQGRSILAEGKTSVQTKLNPQQDPTERASGHRRSTMSSDDDTKDIKNIYVDCVTPVASKKLPMLMNLQNPEEIDNLATHKPVPLPKVIGQNIDNSAKDLAKKEFIINEHDTTAVSLKPSHRRRPSITKLDMEGMSITPESGLHSGANFQRRLFTDAAAKDSPKEEAPIYTCVTKEIQKASSPGDRSVDSNKELKSIKYVNGVAVVNGRTRSLVERFEKKEKLNTDESQTPDLPTQIATKIQAPGTIVKQSFDTVPCEIPETRTTPLVPFEEPEAKSSHIPVKTPPVGATKETEAIALTIPQKGADTVTSAASKTSQMPVKEPDVVASKETDTITLAIPEKGADIVSSAATEARSSPMVQKLDVAPPLVVQRPRTAPSVLPEKGKASPMQRSVSSRRVIPERVRSSPMLVSRKSNASPRMTPERTKTSPVVVVPRHDTPNRMIPERTKASTVVVVPRHGTPNRMIPERTKTSPMVVVPRHDASNRMTPEKAKSSPLLDDSLQTSDRDLMSKQDDDVAEVLMLNHDVFVSSLRSRLTKLQVVRHFFGQNDMRGAINALRKLPDHAVQADVVGTLMERMDSLTLDVFSDLLPMLLNLLDSKTERHISVSLELLLKLVAVFGPVVSSTVSAPPTVGVDLHAEKRLERCNECHTQLQKIHKCLPAIIRRGGLPARCAQELNVILQK